MNNYQWHSRMGWAAVSNKKPGCHLANAWISRSIHILQWRYTAMKYQFNQQLLIPYRALAYLVKIKFRSSCTYIFKIL